MAATENREQILDGTEGVTTGAASPQTGDADV
jgi:hypothetical protein